MKLSKSSKSTSFATTESKKTLHKNLGFTATEQYKLLRANLNFTIPEDVKCPIIGVTSSMRGEGKSTTAINLAYVIAESGKRVLLIDGDLRIPSIAKKMNIESTPGLTDILVGPEAGQTGVLKARVLDNWYILPSGVLPPNPSELLGSRRMASTLKVLAEKFDYIIVDLPPVNLVSDALAISPFLTGMIVVIREDYTEKKELENGLRQLQLSNVNILGCVMNESRGDKKYYGKYKYKKYSSYSEESREV